jgi:hypothetical protein
MKINAMYASELIRMAAMAIVDSLTVFAGVGRRPASRHTR